jgi:glycosyltransferase involved in cell wall biosynthesis
MPSRAASWGRLWLELCAQILPYAGTIELLSDDRMHISVGQKRNELLQKAQGEYVCFIDDDDDITDDYIKLVMEGIETGKDCMSLRGVYICDGVDGGIFEHSIRYKKWETVEGKEVKYLRYPNHLNTIKASIAKKFKFPEKNHGEDYDWSTVIHKSELIQTEHYIDDIMYYYQFDSKK